jgi:hypothetical protein
MAPPLTPVPRRGGRSSVVRELFIVCVVSCRDPFMDHHEEKLHFWMTESEFL